MRRPGVPSSSRMKCPQGRASGRPVPGRSSSRHGLEALTVERPVETRQGEIRALPRPPSHTRGVSQKGRHRADTAGRRGSTPRRPTQRTHTTSRSAADRLSHTAGCRGFDSLLVDCGRGLKWSRRRDVAPEEAGSSPAGHPTARGGSGISGVSYALHAGSIPALATNAQLWAGGATGSAAPLQGEGCGFDSRAVHRNSTR